MDICNRWKLHSAWKKPKPNQFSLLTRKYPERITVFLGKVLLTRSTAAHLSYFFIIFIITAKWLKGSFWLCVYLISIWLLLSKASQCHKAVMNCCIQVSNVFWACLQNTKCTQSKPIRKISFFHREADWEIF